MSVSCRCLDAQPLSTPELFVGLQSPTATKIYSRNSLKFTALHNLHRNESRPLFLPLSLSLRYSTTYVPISAFPLPLSTLPFPPNPHTTTQICSPSIHLHKIPLFPFLHQLIIFIRFPKPDPCIIPPPLSYHLSQPEFIRCSYGVSHFNTPFPWCAKTSTSTFLSAGFSFPKRIFRNGPRTHSISFSQTCSCVPLILSLNSCKLSH